MATVIIKKCLSFKLGGGLNFVECQMWTGGVTISIAPEQPDILKIEKAEIETEL